MRFLDWLGISYLSDRNAKQIIDGINNSNSNGTESQELLTKKGQMDKACTRFDLLAYSFLFSLIQPFTAMMIFLLSLVDGSSFAQFYFKVVLYSGILSYFFILLQYNLTNLKYHSKGNILLRLFVAVQALGFICHIFISIDVWAIVRAFLLEL